MRTFRFVSALVTAVAGLGLAAVSWADGPADNQVATVRQIPPPGVPIEQADRDALTEQFKTLKQKVDELRGSKNPTVQKYLPDVEIFSRAIELALNEDGFFDPKDGQRALGVLKEGIARADALAKGQTPWTRQTGSVVRGFRSKLDGTPQPYGIVYQGDLNTASGIRADIWCRGRSEKGLEVQFLATRMTSPDPVPAPGVMMIHPFGRYCNANKLAGEIDTLEVLEHALSEYPIDPQRVAIRGFSMGGAAAWHLAVHYPDKWFAANPGAGFSETPDFLKVFQKEELKPYPFEQTLWQMYDCPVWVRNLRMLPTIAYSGEIDSQKQAADIMAAASWGLPERERFELTHIIAPKTAHSISPAARAEIEKRLATLDGMRSPKPPAQIHFTTTTLKYNQAHWVTIHALQEHWQPAQVRASMNGSEINLFVDNVAEFSLDFTADQTPFQTLEGRVNISTPTSEAKQQSEDDERRELMERMRSGDPQERQEVQRLMQERMAQGRGGFGGISFSRRSSGFGVAVPRRSDRSWGGRFRRKSDDTWEIVSPIEPSSKDLVKKHNLQGPIDDAFMSPFLFVKPTAAGRHPEVDKWVDAEFNRAVREWHRQMRGEARVKTSEELQPADIENYHLILWGDAQSNPTIAKIADKLPIQWGAEQITVGEQKFDAKTHAPVLIYPNPLNPDKYVVLNSSFTYREYDYLNNARQVPKLPDWAIIDLTTPPDARWPGKIAAGDFFGEKWELKTAR
jgi:pimeloyl-ACP methyl ester carboxylesterase